MRQITLTITAELMAQMGLTDGANDIAVATAIKNLATKAATVDVLQGEKTALEIKVSSLESAGKKKEVSDMLDAARDKGGITNELHVQLGKDYANNPEGLKTLLGTMGAYTPITDVIKQNAEKTSAKYDGKSWDELMENNQMEAFIRDCPQAYKELYKTTFGSYPA